MCGRLRLLGRPWAVKPIAPSNDVSTYSGGTYSRLPCQWIGPSPESGIALTPGSATAASSRPQSMRLMQNPV